MLPAFFGSILELVIKTSTDLPPDVRAAMKAALGNEPAGTQSSQALTIIAENIDQAAEGEGAICQDTGLPTFEIKAPVGANQIVDGAADSRRHRRGHAPRQAAPELGRFGDRQELREQPRPRLARDPLRAVGPGRNRRAPAAQGRRLREHQHPVLGAVRARESRPRRPRPRGRPQVHPARGLAGPGQGMQPGRHRRVHRRRPRRRLPPRQAPAVPDARRRESRPGARPSSKPRSCGR